MALIVLFTLGSAVGWLAAILFRQDSVKQSLVNIGAGAVGSVASYGLAGKSVGSSTISPESLLLGVLGACTLLAFLTLLRRQIAR